MEKSITCQHSSPSAIVTQVSFDEIGKLVINSDICHDINKVTDNQHLQIYFINR